MYLMYILKFDFWFAPQEEKVASYVSREQVAS